MFCVLEERRGVIGRSSAIIQHSYLRLPLGRYQSMIYSIPNCSRIVLCVSISASLQRFIGDIVSKPVFVFVSSELGSRACAQQWRI